MTFTQYSIQHKNYTPMFDMVPHCQVPRCPPPAIWCRIVQSRDVSLHNFDGLAMSSSAFSVAPNASNYAFKTSIGGQQK